MLRLMVWLGMHGKAHMAKRDKVLNWMHNNGLGA